MNSRFSYPIRLICPLALIAFATAGSAFAQDPPAPSTPQKPNTNNNANTTNNQALLDKYFGAGLMANIDFGKSEQKKRVGSARVVGGVVRVEEQSSAQVGFLLEAHKFRETRHTVHGPFLGIVMGEDGQISTGILGWMFGFRQSKDSTQTLNMGLGLSISPNVQVLGDGIVANEPLPPGETEVRYKKITKYGVAFTVSFGF